MKKILFLITLMVSMFTMSSCEKDEKEEKIIELTCDVTSTNVTTNGGTDGSITVTVKTGNSGYNYTISSTNLTTPTSNTSGKFAELKSGNYSVSVTDSKGKTFSKDITITEPNQLTCDVTSTDETTYCGGDGSITIKVNTGNGGYNYTVNTTTVNTTSDTTYEFKNLVPGDYKVTVTDSKNSTFTKTVNIKEKPIPVLTVSVTDITLFSVKLNATVNVGGVSSTGYFQYGQSEPNSTCESTPMSFTGSGDCSPQYIWNNLTPGTTYYCKYVINNTKKGTVYSKTLYFTTPNIKVPTYNLLDLSFTSTSITINGNVNSNDIVPTTVFYEYSTNENFSTLNSTVHVDISGTTTTPISATINLTSLTSSTRYYYRMVVIKNGITYTTNDNRSFTTHIVKGDQMFGGTVFEVNGTYPNQHGKVIQNSNYINSTTWSNVSVVANGKTWVLPTFNEIKNAYNVLSLTTYKLTSSYWTNQINPTPNTNMVFVFESSNQTGSYVSMFTSHGMRLITTF